MNRSGIAFLILAASAHAGPRTSTDYTVPADTTDAGGQRATSTAYTNDGSLGGITGISTVASPAATAKAGYPDHGQRNGHQPAQRRAVARR